MLFLHLKLVMGHWPLGCLFLFDFTLSLGELSHLIQDVFAQAQAPATHPG